MGISKKNKSNSRSYEVSLSLQEEFEAMWNEVVVGKKHPPQKKKKEKEQDKEVGHATV